MTIETFSAIAQIISSTVVIISILVALRTLSEMKNARYLEAMLRIYDMIGSKEARTDRKYVCNKLPNNPGKLKAKDWEIVNRISTQLDRIANLVHHKLVPEKYLLHTHRHLFIKMWEQLEEHIVYCRCKEGAENHVKKFEKFYNFCKN
ncbi:MAG: DUF4760 domain-containing protein [Calditrichia bacterium]